MTLYKLLHGGGLLDLPDWVSRLDNVSCMPRYNKLLTRYTVRGRGAKRRTSSDLTTTYLTRLWSKTTCIRLAAYARSRHIAEYFQKVQYQAWSGGYLFLLTSCKKVPETVSRNGSLNRLIPVANPNKWRVLLRPSKIHNPNHQGPAACVPPPRFSSQKSIIFFPDGRTNGHQIFLCHGWKKRFAQ